MKNKSSYHEISPGREKNTFMLLFLQAVPSFSGAFKASFTFFAQILLKSYGFCFFFVNCSIILPPKLCCEASLSAVKDVSYVSLFFVKAAATAEQWLCLFQDPRLQPGGDQREAAGLSWGLH